MPAVTYISSQESQTEIWQLMFKENHCVILMLCVSHSVVLRILLTVLPEPLSECVNIALFLLLYNREMKRHGNGTHNNGNDYRRFPPGCRQFPDAGNSRMRWLMTDAKGFRHWHDIGTCTLQADYPVLDLVCDKDSTDKSCIYTAEVSDLDGMELMTRLFRYNIIDELVIHILPEIAGTGTHIFQNGVPSGWILSKSTRLKNGICRNIYRRKAR